MSQYEIEYFGGPEDGTKTKFSALTVACEIVHPPRDFVTLQIAVVGGYYQPERQADGVWRLHFYDTVER